MRPVSGLLLSLVFAGYGCASPPDEGAQSGGQDVTAATGTACRVAYEDQDIVVFRAPNGSTSYAPKTLHVVDMKVTPPMANLASDLSGARVAQGHVDYVLAGRSRADALARLNQLVGPGTKPAPVALDATSAGVQTGVPAGASAYSTPDNGATIVAELSDNPSASGAGPLVAVATNKATLTAAHATATVTCGTGTMSVAMTTAAPVAFDVTQAKVFTPGPDLNVLDNFISLSDDIRAGKFTADAAKLNSPDVSTKLNAFADMVDQKIRPIVPAYGLTMQRADLQGAVHDTWNAYLDLAESVLTATQANLTTTTMQTQSSDGTYTFAPSLSPDAQAVLATANTDRLDVEKVLAETGSGWTMQNLQ